jgi:Uri superfamily endonuclease
MPKPRAPGLPGDRGCYLLVVRLRRACGLKIGERSLTLQAGLYGYAGSAQRALAARLARHLRFEREKRPRWHIDRLLARSEVEAVLVYPLIRPGECWLAGRLSKEAGVSLAARGFGSSDCRCPGHLLKFSDPPYMEALEGLALPEELRLRG